MIRLTDYVLKRIEEEGVNRVFYVPGGQCVYITDALRRNEKIKPVAVHHEQSAAMAALSYALYTEKIGACVVTTGCGGTNTITGVLHAWQDGIPCIFISGQQNLNMTIAASGLPLRQVGVQEAEIVKIVSSITKYSEMITDPYDIAKCMDKALYYAKEGRMGPVWIDIPLDIQNAMIDEDKIERFVPENPYVNAKPSADDVDEVINLLNKSERPVILAGHGIHCSKARNELKEVIEKFKIPTVFTRFSIDLLPTEHELNYGVVSVCAANRRANFIIQNSDLVLSIGSRLSIDTTGPQRDEFAREANIVVIDIDKTEHSKKGVNIDKLIISDAKEFLIKLAEQKLEKTYSMWIDKCNHWKKIFPDYRSPFWKEDLFDVKYVLSEVSSYFPEKACIVSSAGMTGLATPVNCKIKENDRSLYSFAQGEMGYCLPGAIGVSSISDGPVIAISSEGSIMMNLQELQTISRNNYDIKMIIINNNGYCGVRHGQSAHFRGKTIGTDPDNGIDFPDFEKLAASFNLPYCKIQTEGQLYLNMKKIFTNSGPYICEIICDPEQFDLHNALVKCDKRTIKFRPIEDQSPFVDRDVFFEEMIVKPLDASYGTPI